LIFISLNECIIGALLRPKHAIAFTFSCTKGKKEVLGKVRAEELYTSDLFKKSLTYAKQLTTPENIYILSDKYYLLPLDEEIEFYDVLLEDKTD